MPYFNAACLEVFRYFSIVPVTSREAIKDPCILHTPVPAKASVVLVPRVTNCSSTLWDSDAHIFKLNLWISREKTGIRNISTLIAPYKDSKSDGLQNETTKKRTHHQIIFAVVTFSHGLRSYISNSFVKAELAILLASLVGNFEFMLVRQIPINDKEIKVSRSTIA